MHITKVGDKAKLSLEYKRELCEISRKYKLYDRSNELLYNYKNSVCIITDIGFYSYRVVWSDGRTSRFLFRKLSAAKQGITK